MAKKGHYCLACFFLKPLDELCVQTLKGKYLCKDCEARGWYLRETVSAYLKIKP